VVLEHVIRSQRTEYTVVAASNFEELMVRRTPYGEDSKSLKGYEGIMKQNNYNQEMKNKEQLVAEKRAQKQDQANYEEEVQQQTEYKQQEETYVGKEEKKE